MTEVMNAIQAICNNAEKEARKLAHSAFEESIIPFCNREGMNFHVKDKESFNFTYAHNGKKVPELDITERADAKMIDVMITGLTTIVYGKTLAVLMPSYIDGNVIVSSDEQDVIIDVSYESVWESTSIETSAKLNLRTGEVFNIETSNELPDDNDPHEYDQIWVEGMDKAFVIDDEDEPCVSSEDLNLINTATQ